MAQKGPGTGVEGRSGIDGAAGRRCDGLERRRGGEDSAADIARPGRHASHTGNGPPDRRGRPRFEQAPGNATRTSTPDPPRQAQVRRPKPYAGPPQFFRLGEVRSSPGVREHQGGTDSRSGAWRAGLGLGAGRPLCPMIGSRGEPPGNVAYTPRPSAAAAHSMFRGDPPMRGNAWDVMDSTRRMGRNRRARPSQR